MDQLGNLLNEKLVEYKKNYFKKCFTIIKLCITLFSIMSSIIIYFYLLHLTVLGSDFTLFYVAALTIFLYKEISFSSGENTEDFS